MNEEILFAIAIGLVIAGILCFSLNYLYKSKLVTNRYFWGGASIVLFLINIIPPYFGMGIGGDNPPLIIARGVALAMGCTCFSIAFRPKNESD